MRAALVRESNLRFSANAARRSVTGRVPGIQPKLRIGQVNDPFEREADHVADQVMRMPAPGALGACACGGQCPRCQGQKPGEELLQPKRQPPSAVSSEVPAQVPEVLQSPGQVLDTSTRRFMEARFGRDFGDVRVHTDERAAESAHAISAVAYTVGRDIVFGAGHYAPQSSDGRRLLAHELTHTIQQSERATPSVARLAAPPIRAGAHDTLQRVGECAGKSNTNCFGKCVHTSGIGGFCTWSGSIKTGCVCVPRDQPMLRAAKQFLFDAIIAALIVAGIVLTAVAVAAIVACLMGPCEVGVLIGALGWAAAMLVLAIIRSGGGGGAGDQTAAAGETATSGENATA
jgi:hypothetical protein